MKIRNLDKLPKRKVTIDELLGLDEIKDILDELLAENMSEVIVIWSKEGEPFFSFRSNGIALSRLVYILESVKLSLFNGD